MSTNFPPAAPSDEPDEGPERYAPALLRAPAEERLAHFERQCTIKHARLQEACDAVLHAICSPGDGARLNRPGAMVLVIGPSRVGKTTLVRVVEQRLLVRARERMRDDPGHIPFVRFTAVGSGSGRYDWMDYYKAVLRQVGDPFVDRAAASVRVRDMREAAEEALIQRQPYAVIVDEAHHLAKAANGRRVQDQLDHLKYLENRTGVSHVLVGTYEMRPFRTVNAQLACRSMDVHFRRYDATKTRDRTIFRSVVWALQWQLPVADEPPLVERQWEFLYARSIGCIGLLKVHLNRALELALAENARTVTVAHLQATALTEDRAKLALGAALAGEADLTEPDGADERLLTLLGLGASDAAQGTGGPESPPRAGARGHRPGERRPGRDPIGATAPGERGEDERADRATG